MCQDHALRPAANTLDAGRTTSPSRESPMPTLYSWPDLFGVADNNPFGLKVYAFMRLTGLEFEHRHVLDPSAAPRGQLPYLRDGDEIVGDSDVIITHLTKRFDLRIDSTHSPGQSNLDFL